MHLFKEEILFHLYFKKLHESSALAIYHSSACAGRNKFYIMLGHPEMLSSSWSRESGISQRCIKTWKQENSGLIVKSVPVPNSGVISWWSFNCRFTVSLPHSASTGRKICNVANLMDLWLTDGQIFRKCSRELYGSVRSLLGAAWNANTSLLETETKCLPLRSFSIGSSCPDLPCILYLSTQIILKEAPNIYI